MIAGQRRFEFRSRRDLKYLGGLWTLVIVAVGIWIAVATVGWDVAVYHHALRSLAAGHDPYEDAMAVQRMFHSHKAPHANVDPPYSYVYSPITIPVLRFVAFFPAWLSGSVYWLIYIAGVLGQVWVGLQATERKERRYLLCLAPISIFFPGLLANAAVISGNIAFILYAVILVAAVHAWRGGSWKWFYAAVLGASCVKAPMLTLVVIPMLSARRQWIRASVTAAAGVALFAIQPPIWPTLFRSYLQAVELQFSYNRDFGCSPAGLFSGFLYDHHIPYTHAGLIFYLCYAIPLLVFLLHLSRGFFQDCFTLQQWMPVLLVGVILLNPRVMEYDVAPIALPLALIAWRSLSPYISRTNSVWLLSLAFVVANAFALSSWDLRKLMEGPLLVFFFIAGSRNLLQLSRQSRSLALELAAA